VKRFGTLVTMALVVAAVVTQWQRVKELGRQVLSRRGGEEMSLSANENKALARRWADIFNQDNLDLVEEIYASDSVLHDPAMPEDTRGVWGARDYYSMYRGAFPDAQVTIEDQLAEGEKVTTRWTARGTHQGELMGVPPSGNRVEVPGITIRRIEGGKVAEEWNNYDALGLMQQIGAIPEQ
jgi:steroid delta-isomerase-like uncharacterized protein